MGIRSIAVAVIAVVSLTNCGKSSLGPLPAKNASAPAALAKKASPGQPVVAGLNGHFEGACTEVRTETTASEKRTTDVVNGLWTETIRGFADRACNQIVRTRVRTYETITDTKNRQVSLKLISNVLSFNDGKMVGAANDDNYYGYGKASKNPADQWVLNTPKAVGGRGRISTSPKELSIGFQTKLPYTSGKGTAIVVINGTTNVALDLK